MNRPGVQNKVELEEKTENQTTDVQGSDKSQISYILVREQP